MADRLCAIDDCDRLHYGKGYCQKHYSRWRAHGDPLVGAAVRNPETCVVDVCDKPARARGLCAMHYQRQRLTGTVDLVPKPRKPRPKRVGVEPCEIEGCDKLMVARGWCTAHWTRWKRHGSPLAQLPGEVVDGKRICPHCSQSVPIENWYVTPKGRLILCRSCFGEWNRDRGHRRRAVTSGARFTRREILERDDWTCQLCGVAIDPVLVHPHPMSPTLDHVIPVSRGGAHSRENAQAAHRICNMRKWANVGEVA